MSIKLEIYLKRTQQTLKDWMEANGVASVPEFVQRCSYIGLAASNADVQLAKSILQASELEKVIAQPLSPQVSEPVHEVKAAPMEHTKPDRPKKKKQEDIV